MCKPGIRSGAAGSWWVHARELLRAHLQAGQLLGGFPALLEGFTAFLPERATFFTQLGGGGVRDSAQGGGGCDDGSAHLAE